MSVAYSKVGALIVVVMERNIVGSEPSPTPQSRHLIERKLERAASVNFNVHHGKTDFCIRQLLANLNGIVDSNR